MDDVEFIKMKNSFSKDIFKKIKQDTHGEKNFALMFLTKFLYPEHL